MTPDLCSIVWLPGEKTLITSNFLGALYGGLPNFYTIRGDRQRSVAVFLREIQAMIDLAPELLVTGHEEPIAGRDRIRADLEKVRDAVRYLHDETVKGMNAGKDLFTLMREIELPAHLEPAPGRAPAHWSVRAVWEEYSGWFRHESTTELYGVPARAVWDDLLEMIGDPERIIARARRYLDRQRPEQALHLTDIVLHRTPSHREARETEIAALEMLIDRSGGTAFDEMGWLENAIREARAALRGDDQQCPKK
jgi:alkyl sulfatase BDS1-like metallo-beta-lactamase superfamily hydrolase